MAYTFLSLWNDYGIISVLVVLASVGIVAIVYMIGRAIANEKMMAWATDEFYQAFASLLIIALVLFLFGFFTKFVLQLLNVADFQCSPFAGTCTYTEYRMRQTVLVAGEMYTITRECGAAGNACHIAIAQSKVNSMFDLVRFVAVEKVMRGGLLRNLKSFNIRMKEQWSGILGMFSKFAKVKFAPFVGVSTLIDTYGMVIDRLTNLLKFLMVHSAFFTLIEKVVFPIFLVIGITLRAFFPLRKIGGLLIATAVALYFVYPLLFILQSMILSPDPDKFPITFEEFKENTEVQLTYEGSTETVPSNIITSIFSWFGREVNGQEMDAVTYYIFRVVRPGGDLDISAFMVVWIIVPEIIVIYTVVLFIKELSPFFGGDAGIANLSKLI